MCVTASACATRASFFREIRLPKLKPRSGYHGKPLASAPGAAWSGQEGARASPSRLGHRPRGLRCALALYEFVLVNLYKKWTNCMNLYYTICIIVIIVWIRTGQFVYKKLVKKRFASGLGFQPGTKIRAWNRRALPPPTPPPPWVANLFIYPRRRKKNTIRKMRCIQIHPYSI